jgi:hypothetical protein
MASNLPLVTVTPCMAAGWLGDLRGGTHPEKVAAMAFAMRAGRWTGEPTEIIISKAGRVINGAHRLTALIAARASLKFLVRVE